MWSAVGAKKQWVGPSKLAVLIAVSIAAGSNTTGRAPNADLSVAGQMLRAPLNRAHSEPRKGPP
jgi:hypothetical protein